MEYSNGGYVKMYIYKMLEKVIQKKDLISKKETLDWCYDMATYSHKTRDEYIFWVPKDANPQFLELEYGEDMPQVITEGILIAANQGCKYLQVVFL